MSVVLLLPLTIALNWKLGLLLIGTCIVFGVLAALVVNKTATLQSSVEEHYSDLAERASDTLGNIALVQGFARAESEVLGLKELVDRLLTAQIPVLSWWAVAAVLTRASTTLTFLMIFLVGIWLHLHGQASFSRCAAAAGVFSRPRYRTRGARSARRYRSRPCARPRRVQGCVVLLRRQARGGRGSQLHRAAGRDDRA